MKTWHQALTSGYSRELKRTVSGLLIFDFKGEEENTFRARVYSQATFDWFSYCTFLYVI